MEYKKSVYRLDKNMGELLSQERKAQRLSQSIIAQRMNSSQNNISYLERGQSKHNIHSYARYAAALNKRLVITLEDDVGYEQGQTRS